MSVASKLFGVWVVNKTVASATPLLIRLLVGMAAITVCAVFAAIVIAILVIGIVWVAYTHMLHYGINEGSILIIMGSLMLALLSYIVMRINEHLRRISAMAKKIFYLHSPINGMLSEISNAFMDGFNSTQSPKV